MKHFTLFLLLFFSLSAVAQFNPPVHFEADTTNFSLVDFGENASSIVVDPTDGTNNVAMSIKTSAAMTWAGTSLDDNGFTNPLPFSNQTTIMTVRVWSPDANTPILLKAEDSNDPTKSVETLTNTTMAGAWETLTFDFSDEAPGTAVLNLANSYNKVSIFFNFGTDGATAGEKTYFWDDVQFVMTGPPPFNPPVHFEADTANFSLVDFGENASSIVVDPTDANNNVAMSIKTSAAMSWAGTSLNANGFTNPLPFTSQSTTMTVRVWSPDANTPILLKAEDSNDPTISVETLTNTTMAGAWETLIFDFSNEAPGTAALNLANSYNKVSVFFNFGTDGATAGEKTYFWDDVQFVMTGPPPFDPPVHFEADTANFALADFGGNASSFVVDPTNANNNVAMSIKTGAAMTWAGTSLDADGFTSPLPFTMTETTMTVRVWSPDANTPVRLKAEDSSDPTISVETEVSTTMAGAWETLTFDFSDEAAGTAALNLANSYNKVSVFFNFGTDGATAGEKTYFWDDVQFVMTGPPPFDPPVHFEADTANFALADFGGNASSFVVDPTDATNNVAMSIKTSAAQTWAGTSLDADGFTNPLPFTMTETTMTVRVWSPDANTPVRLKAEDSSDPTISVETEVNTTMAGAWETLTFDFSDEAAGTATLNLANSYNKVSVFFNFGTDGATAGEKTYFWDDVQFGGNVATNNLDASEHGIQLSPNPTRDILRIDLPEAISGLDKIYIYDMNGLMVKSLTGEHNQVDLSNLSTGMYFIMMNTGESSYTERILLVK